MKTIVQKLHETTDRIVAASLRVADAHPPCCAGCFHCCREPVYATGEEVKNMLESLSPEQRDSMRSKTEEWLATFNAHNIGEAARPSAFTYRTLNMWCPFLVDGKCSAYAERPLACRLHFAQESNRGCEDDSLRPQQTFAIFPELAERIGMHRMEALEPGEKLTHDHLGLLLAKELLGVEQRSKSYVGVECDKDGESLIIEKYGEDE
jgi:Fe-S-cluster containining protein